MRREFWCEVCNELRISFNDDDIDSETLMHLEKGATSEYCAKCGSTAVEKFGVFND